MYGAIFVELKRYVEERVGPDAWPALEVEAGLPGKVYLATDTYPDDDAYALVGAASRATRRAASAILQDFGEFLAPQFMRTYGGLADPAWTTLAFLEHLEETIHRVVRHREAGASPPDIRCARTSPSEVTITYTSARKMCPLAKGLVHGVARHYGERVTLLEPTCLLKGAAQCLIVVRLVPPEQA